MSVYLSENRIEVRPFDEWMVETLVEAEIDTGQNCAGCGARCMKTVTATSGEAFECLDCDWLVIVDRRHYRPLCKACFATFGQPRSTAEGIFGL